MCCLSYQYLVTERKEARPQKLYKLMCMQAHEQKINKSVILLAWAIYQQIKGKKGTSNVEYMINPKMSPRTSDLSPMNN